MGGGDIKIRDSVWKRCSFLADKLEANERYFCQFSTVNYLFSLMFFSPTVASKRPSVWEVLLACVDVNLNIVYVCIFLNTRYYLLVSLSAVCALNLLIALSNFRLPITSLY